jgi:hypothetical protein
MNSNFRTFIPVVAANATIVDRQLPVGEPALFTVLTVIHLTSNQQKGSKPDLTL